MKVIHLPKGYGKTTILIKMSAENNIPILCQTRLNASDIINKANKLNLEIPSPLVLMNKELHIYNKNENKLTSYRGRKPIPAIYIDGADFILRDILGIEIDAITVTSGHNASICETFKEDNTASLLKKIEAHLNVISQEKNLSFGTALNYAMNGRKIRRSDWTEGMYVKYISNTEYNLATDMFDDLPASFTLFYKEDVCIDWFPTMSDIDSDKWEVVN